MVWTRGLAWGLLCVLAGVLGNAASAAGEAKTIELFNGRSLDGWIAREPGDRSRWKVASAKLAPQDASRLAAFPPGTSAGVLVNDAEPKPRTKEERTVDLYTRRSFGDCTISLEFMVPEGGNSGVYVMGEPRSCIKVVGVGGKFYVCSEE